MKMPWNWILYPARTLVFLALDTFSKWTTVTNINVSRILLIRVDAIGDFILWLSSAEVIRKKYPDNIIILVCNKSCVELAAATCLFDQVYGIDSRRFTRNIIYRFLFIRKIAAIGSGTVIQPTFSRDLLIGDTLVRASRASKRIGSIGDLANRSRWHQMLGDRWYTHLIPAAVAPLMELERNAEFLRNLGCSDVEPAVVRLRPFRNKQLTRIIEDGYIVIFPGASEKIRMWSSENFAHVADMLCSRFDLRPVVCGGPNELELAEALISASSNGNWVNLVGSTSLLEFAELLRGANLVISNETLAVHLAAAVKTPSVCILGGGHFGRFVPYPDAVQGAKPIAVYHRMDCFGCNWRCHLTQDLTQAYPCVAAVRRKQVLKVAEEMIRLANKNC